MSVAHLPQAAFDSVAAHYDETFTHSVIGRAQRSAVWEIATTHFRGARTALELNCGTGEDALFLASLGMNVLACDISSSMIEVGRAKAAKRQCGAIEFRTLAVENLVSISPEHSFDAVLSNFSGLNCLADLAGVARDVARLTKTGGKAVLCLSNKYCFWETAWYLLHCDTRRAFRRWTSRPVSAHIGKNVIEVRYPSISEIVSDFSPHFSVAAIHGIGIIVPPSYLEPWARQSPSVVRVCAKLDKLVSKLPFCRSIGDHCVLVLERTAA